MEPTEVRLLDAIRATPDDDAPRLVYADWLQQRGDPRGEYIARACAGDAAGAAALWAAHADDWLAAIPETLRARGYELDRGFVSRVRCDGSWLRDLVQWIDTLVTLAPIPIVELRSSVVLVRGDGRHAAVESWARTKMMAVTDEGMHHIRVVALQSGAELAHRAEWGVRMGPGDDNIRAMWFARDRDVLVYTCGDRDNVYELAW